MFKHECEKLAGDENEHKSFILVQFRLYYMLRNFTSGRTTISHKAVNIKHTQSAILLRALIHFGPAVCSDPGLNKIPRDLRQRQQLFKNFAASEATSLRR
jgi:hypothetical protein